VNPMQWILLAAVRAYQVLLGPIFGGQCRFYPSCSHYAHEAIERWGARRGAWLGIKRLMRCHPLAKGGYDPVPENLHGRKNDSQGQAHEQSRAEAAP
jgi:putative membrane protein insertion efficiency factor